MSIDLFEQLAQEEVPPPRETFRSELHGRLNRSLVVVQVVEFAVLALARAVADFVPAIAGLLAFTASGKWPRTDTRSRKR